MSHTTTPPPVFDRASLLDRVDGDADLLGVIIDIFLEDAPNALRAIETARAAGDAPALRLAAHALKGAAANISAEALRAAAHELESLAAEGCLMETDAALARVRSAVAALAPALQAARGGQPC